MAYKTTQDFAATRNEFKTIQMRFFPKNSSPKTGTEATINFSLDAKRDGDSGCYWETL
jgi:hypothetical protein